MELTLIQEAINGNKKALEDLVVSVKDKIYNLSLRYLWHPTDAEDATQEILIKIITNLSTFEGKSLFSTWCFRIAANYLLNQRRDRYKLTFLSFSNQLKEGLERTAYTEADANLLEQEVKTGCTLGMLLCLSPDLRLVFILDAVFNLNSREASAIINTSPETFRKRLSRARESMEHFMQANCGLVNKARPCRCKKRIPIAIETKRVDPKKLLFADKVSEYNSQMEELHNVFEIFKSHPDYKTSPDFLGNIFSLLASKRYSILRDKIN